MKDIKKHGEVIQKYNDLNERLKPFGLEIYAWGRLAVRKIDKPHDGYFINNVDDIDVIAGFVDGLEFKK